MAKRAYIAAPGATIPVPGTVGLAGPVRRLAHDVANALWAEETSPSGRRLAKLAQRGEAIDVTDQIKAAAPPVRSASKSESKGSS